MKIGFNFARAILLGNRFKYIAMIESYFTINLGSFGRFSRYPGCRVRWEDRPGEQPRIGRISRIGICLERTDTPADILRQADRLDARWAASFGLCAFISAEER